MATSLDGTRRWTGKGVRVAEVAARLRELRADASGELHSTLTSVMNLVVWAGSPESALEAEDVIDGLADHHPSRAVIVVPGGGGDGIDARVEVMPHPERPGGRALQVEQIILGVRGGVAAHSGSAVIPLLRSELPTFLWWPQAPEPDLPAFLDLARIADRLVTEVGRSLRGAAAVERLAAIVAASSAPVTDLAWAAVTGWRQLVATSLRGAALARLRAGRAVATVTVGPGEPPLEALLLGGWLADALGDGVSVRFARGGGHGAVRGVRLDANGSCALELACGDGPATVTVRTAAGGARCVPLVPPGRRDLLAGELEHRGRDLALERALTRALEFAATG